MAEKLDYEIAKLKRIKGLCGDILNNQKDVNAIRELRKSISETSSTVVRVCEKVILAVLVPILKASSQAENNFKENDKEEIVDTLKELFKKIRIENLQIFFNVYGFLLFEIYDHKNHKVFNISEEYKLSIVECAIELVNCLNCTVVEELYVKEHVPKLSQMLFTLLEIVKNEKFRKLRVRAIECIMALSCVLDDEHFSDHVLRNQIAEVFLFFLPGIATQLMPIILMDEKFGHQLPCIALKAWSRIVTLQMTDYSASDEKIVVSDITTKMKKTNFQDISELNDYLKNTKRTPNWYKENDEKLKNIIKQFTNLTQHSDSRVRRELLNLASLILKNCLNTMPLSIIILIDILIILSEDCDQTTALKSKEILSNLSEQISQDEFKTLLENLQDNFYSIIASLPRNFNSFDEKIQIVALNSMIGYINLFGKYKLTQVLLSSAYLNKLILTLVHISEFETNVSILEEYATPDYDLNREESHSWKKFRNFKEISVRKKIEQVCKLLANFGGAFIISDFLLDLIQNNREQRKEAIFLLNNLITGLHNQDLSILKNITSVYTDQTIWYLPLDVKVDEFGYKHNLSDVQDNLIQVCLLVEGVGKIALVLKQDFQIFLLKTLYLVLERAGSNHPIIQSAGITALTNISKACGYTNITDLINNNIDYFSFHIEKRLNRNKQDLGSLDVLNVVIKYGTKQVLQTTCVLIDKLLESFDNRKNQNSYFYVFKMFIKGLEKWLEIEMKFPFKTKKQKEEEFEEFQVSNIETIENFSDDIMEKSAEEMFKEDMEKCEEVEEIQDEYKKPTPPIYIKLTVGILAKSVHYLPSKDKNRKLLVLEILKNGLPIIKDWEDELLPIVHQIWSPLVDRFKEVEEPLIINYSFQLLIILAKLSKEFIRSRTSKEVLPNIIQVLEKLSNESFLKGKGSPYCYTQKYKLQVTVLENIGGLCTDLCLLEQDFEKVIKCVVRYTNEKQHPHLRKCALQFFKLLIQYDPSFKDHEFIRKMVLL